jgi:DNA-binding NarL/FixJ family response regulator
MFLSLDEALEVVGEAEDGAEAVRLTRELTPDVVLMDLLMPAMDGISATRVIRRDHPETEVVALTSVLDDRLVFEAIEAGATGYLLKDTKGDQLCLAIKSAAAGQVQLSPQAVALMVDHVDLPDSPESLTAREIEVLRLLAAGMANREIGVTLGITLKTVKTHVSHILSKLDVASRVQAALYAVQAGLVTLGEEEMRM